MHSENMEINHSGKRLFHTKFRVYRPKAKKVVHTLLKRFCANCLRAYRVGRGFKLQRSACRNCPVLEAIVSIDPKLEWVRRERERLKKCSAAVRGV